MQEEKLKQATHTDRYLIICDLDGTLLDDKSEISEYSKKIIKDVVNAGHIFCIATGRPWRSSSRYYKQLGLNTLIANLNGSFIHNPSKNKVNPLNFVFSTTILKRLLEDKELMKYVINFLTEDKDDLIAYKPIEENVKEQLETWFHTDFQEFPPKIGFEEYFAKSSNLNSILIQIESNSDLDKVVTRIKRTIGTLSCQIWSLKSQGYIVEVNTQFSSKANALKYFSSYYGITLDRTIAFGDNQNDASMLQSAFNSFAMKNSTNTAKFLSRAITEFDNNNDGVAKALINFFSEE